MLHFTTIGIEDLIIKLCPGYRWCIDDQQLIKPDSCIPISPLTDEVALKSDSACQIIDHHEIIAKTTSAARGRVL